MDLILRNKLLLATYAMTFLYALHYAIPLYATSSYLHKYYDTSTVSAIYVLGSAFGLFASLRVARSIKQFHTYNFTFGIAIAEIIILTLFGVTENIYLLPIFFIIHFMLQTLLFISLNVFIESFSVRANTGSIRGFFLAILNLGVIISPLIGGKILSLSHGSFTPLYTTASLILVPFLYFLHKYLHHVKEPAYRQIDIITAGIKAFKDKNLRAVVLAELMLESFYAVMIIYSPIYLTTIGVPLTSYLTIILPIALIPLVILPYELGLLADKKFGEKEMLIVGLLTLTVTVFLCVVFTTTNVYSWAMLFLVSRIGASLVETMSFTYYFKKVSKEDPSLTALFVSMRGVATLLVGSIGIIIAPFITQRPQLMFIILGCAILWSISYVLPMKDTR